MFGPQTAVVLLTPPLPSSELHLPPGPRGQPTSGQAHGHLPERSELPSDLSAGGGGRRRGRRGRRGEEEAGEEEEGGGEEEGGEGGSYPDWISRKLTG